MFDVVLTSFDRYGRQMDVETTLCAYVKIEFYLTWIEPDQIRSVWILNFWSSRIVNIEILSMHASTAWEENIRYQLSTINKLSTLKQKTPARVRVSTDWKPTCVPTTLDKLHAESFYPPEIEV